MFSRYEAHESARAIWEKRNKKKSEFAHMHKRGLISKQYESVYKYAK